MDNEMLEHAIRAGCWREAIHKNRLYNLLTNVTYTGRIQFAGELVVAEHAAVVDEDTWHQVQARMRENSRTGGRLVRNKHHAVLKGILRCAHCESGMTHTYTKKGSRLYRYYTCNTAHQRGWNTCPTRSVPAPEIESAVVDQIRGISRHPELLLRLMRQLEKRRSPSSRDQYSGSAVAEVMRNFDKLWASMTAHEQQMFVRTIVEHVRFDGRTADVTVVFRSAEARAYSVGHATGNAVEG